MADVVKLVVFHRALLRAKYGPKSFAKIDAELARLVAADKKRGIRTELVAVDDLARMKDLGASAVKVPTLRKQYKDAIDDLYRVLDPAYLLILGAPDVFPYQSLENILTGKKDDGDPNVPSDLPYACDSAYSRDPRDFVGPTRVVGRLPDVPGDSDPTLLIGLLRAAQTWKSRPAKVYAKFFGLSADVWKESTRRSLRKVFGSHDGLQTSPPDAPPFSDALLSQPTHFINCHGEERQPNFFGEKDDEFPIAHDPKRLARVDPGTIVAAECCYGAELFDPFKAKSHRSICNEYLAQGALGFLGSTNIAYGGDEDSIDADIVCIEFMRAVLAGASLGRALLLARQKYIRGEDDADPFVLKTLAQFNLLGDPSIHPVLANGKSAKTAKKGAKKTASKATKAKLIAGVPARRSQLTKKGQKLLRETRVSERVAATPESKLSAGVRNEALARGIEPRRALTFAIKPPKGPANGAKEKARKGADQVFGTYQVVFDQKKRAANAPIKPRRAIIVREIGGKIAWTYELHQR